MKTEFCITNTEPIARNVHFPCSTLHPVYVGYRRCTWIKRQSSPLRITTAVRRQAGRRRAVAPCTMPTLFCTTHSLCIYVAIRQSRAFCHACNLSSSVFSTEFSARQTRRIHPTALRLRELCRLCTAVPLISLYPMPVFLKRVQISLAPSWSSSLSSSLLARTVL